MLALLHADRFKPSVDISHHYFLSMSSEQKPEVVTSAAYHVDTDEEDFDVKTSAVMDYDADTDDEGFAPPAAAFLAAAVMDKDVNKVVASQ